MNALKVCNLFSGIGGIDLGFLQAGYEIVCANEIDKCAADNYKYNLGHKAIVVGDIKTSKLMIYLTSMF